MVESCRMSSSSRRPHSWSSAVIALAIALSTVVGLGVGFATGRWDAGVSPASAGPRIGSFPGDIDFALFWDVWNLVKEEYVDAPVDDEVLFHGAIAGLVAGLGDPYSEFFDPVAATEFDAEISGTFSGIGAEIGADEEGWIVVVAPIAETPAERAGLQTDDHILAIDGVDTYGMSVTAAVRRIRGEQGTPVTLTVLRAQEDPRDIEIIRETIHTKSVTWEIRDDHVAVVRITQFNEDTVGLFAQAQQEVLAAGATGMILDLRNNPGGLLDAAVRIAGYYVGVRPVVLEVTPQERTPLFADGSAALATLPTVVLVNQGSASASEILAGALQDYGLARIMGATTFGKGSVQQYHELPDGSAVKITVARWETPNGRSIDHDGITPDITLSPDELSAAHDLPDPAIAAAVRLLTTP